VAFAQYAAAAIDESNSQDPAIFELQTQRTVHPFPRILFGIELYRAFDSMNAGDRQSGLHHALEAADTVSNLANHDVIEHQGSDAGAFFDELHHASELNHNRREYNFPMRYLVTAKVKPNQDEALESSIERGTLGRGSVAGDEYLRNMAGARQLENGSVQWVEICYCPTPLQEERPYWEKYFDLLKVQDAHARSKCRDWNGSQYWACEDCDCTDRLEARLRTKGRPFRPSGR
jgi:hypothetical protein